MQKVDLSSFNNSWYKPGSIWKRGIWYLINALVFDSWLFPFNSLKCGMLRLFGAKIGEGVIIKPRVNIKYPWFLSIGDFTWIGEGVWIDNLAFVSVGANACISQEAMILTGNHNYKKSDFALSIHPVTIEDGCWVGAKCLVGPGVVMRNHSVLLVNSVAAGEMEAFGIYQGNPSLLVRKRIIE